MSLILFGSSFVPFNIVFCVFLSFSSCIFFVLFPRLSSYLITFIAVVNWAPFSITFLIDCCWFFVHLSVDIMSRHLCENCGVFCSIIVSQCCVGFCCTMKGISYIYTCIPFLLDLPPTTTPRPSRHPTHLGNHRTPS